MLAQKAFAYLSAASNDAKLWMSLVLYYFTDTKGFV